MNMICSFPSKIHCLCRRPFTSRDLLPLGLSLAAIAALTTLLLRGMTPLPAALGLGVFCAAMSFRLVLQLILTRKQYQPVTMEILAGDGSFCVNIPRLDLAGYPRRQESRAPLNSLSAFEYSASLRCIRLSAAFTSSLYEIPGNRLISTPEVFSYYLYLTPEDEQPVLSTLEELFGRRAVRMDPEE